MARLVGLFRNAEKGEWAKVGPDERKIGRQAGRALVDVGKRLKVREMNHREEGLLEGVLDAGQFSQNQVQLFLDAGRGVERTIDTFADLHPVLSEAAFVGGVGKQVLR